MHFNPIYIAMEPINAVTHEFAVLAEYPWLSGLKVIHSFNIYQTDPFTIVTPSNP